MLNNEIMNTNRNIVLVAKKLGLNEWQVENTIRLMDDGATIPFISRYRKEMTGSLDEVKLMHIKDEYDRLKDLDDRRESILKSIEEQEKMTPELRQLLYQNLKISIFRTGQNVVQGQQLPGKRVLNRLLLLSWSRKSVILL
jgi:transcriptional accessory protein Tex/SPT6